jgi:hypothetical protein
MMGNNADRRVDVSVKRRAGSRFCGVLEAAERALDGVPVAPCA